MKKKISLSDVMGRKPSPEIKNAAYPSTENQISGPENGNGNEDEIEEDEETAFLDKDKQNEVENTLVNELGNEGKSETNNIGGNILGASDVTNTIEPVTTDDGKIAFKVFISGRMLLLGADNIIPGAMLNVPKLVGYKVEKKIEDLKLTKDEIDNLEPLADAVVQDIFEKFSPMQQFLMMLGITYGGKIIS